MKTLFITLPNNSGSTLLREAIGRCSCAINIGQAHTRVGYPGPGVPGKYKRLWTEDKRIADPKSYNFEEMVKVFDNWAFRRNKKLYGCEGTVIVEKGPPNVVRARMLDEAFDNAYFILGMRNPLAFCEGIVRRKADANIKRSIEHWLNCAKYQQLNKATLNRWIWLSYEDVCDDPTGSAKKIASFIPSLCDVDFTAKEAIREAPIPIINTRNRLTNLNKVQVDRLRPNQRQKILDGLAEHADLVSEMGYDLASL